MKPQPKAIRAVRAGLRRAPAPLREGAVRLINGGLRLVPTDRSPVLVIGHPRSGTSWVGRTLAAHPDVLYYPEPCNPTHHPGPDARWFTNRYFQPGSEADYFERSYCPALDGLVVGRLPRLTARTLRRRLRPGYQVVVKDVSSFLSIGWVTDRYAPRVVATVRHPGAVLASELRRLGDGWDPNPAGLLNQPALIDDHLAPFTAALEGASTDFDRRATSIMARYRVFANEAACHPEWLTVRYEELAADPVAGYRGLFRALDLAWTDELESHVRRTTTTPRPGVYVTSRVSADHIDRWRDELDAAQVARVEELAETFDLCLDSPAFVCPEDRARGT